MVIGSQTKLNLIPSGVMPVVYINQSDAGYDKEFLIYNGDSPYNVPSGVSATIRGTKADGYGVTEAATVTTGSNLVTVTITEQMVAAAGKNLYELVFVDTNDLRVASINMIWMVKKDALGDSVISDSDLDYATTVMNELQSVQAFKNQLDKNTTDIATETATRIAADNTERTARIAADTALQNNITSEASTRATQDALLSARMDTFSSLPSGSTAGNAELVDIRVAVNGATYDSAGASVRGQLGMVGGTSYNMFNSAEMTPGWYGSNGSISQTSAPEYRLTPMLSVSPNMPYIVQADNPSYLGMQMVWFDSSQTFIRRDNYYTQNYATVFCEQTAPANAAYLRVGFYYQVSQTLTAAVADNLHTLIAQSDVKKPYVKYFGGEDLSARRITDNFNEPYFSPLIQHKITQNEYEQGNIRVGDGILDPTATDRLATGFFNCQRFSSLEVYVKEGLMHRVTFYDFTGAYISTTEQATWHYRNYVYTMPLNGAFFRISIREQLNTAMTPATVPYCVFAAHVNMRVDERTKLTGGICSVLGDSLSTYAGTDNWVRSGVLQPSDGVFTVEGMLCRYPTFGMLENEADMYWQKLMTYYDMTLGVNYSQAGATVVSGSNSMSDPERVKNLGVPNLIIVNGGTNDITNHSTIGTFDQSSPAAYTDAQIDAMDRSTFYNALKAMLSAVQHYYPNARVLYVMPNFAASNYTPADADQYIEAIRVVCDYFGIPTVDARRAGVNLFNMSSYYGDGLHYNSAGMQLLFEECRRAIDNNFR